MSRYVDIESLGVGECNRDVFIVPEYADGWNRLYKIIKDAPTADVQEVKHGRWIVYCIFDDLKKCTACGSKGVMFWGIKFNYCPHCGAKMDEEEKENAEAVH